MVGVLLQNAIHLTAVEAIGEWVCAAEVGEVLRELVRSGDPLIHHIHHHAQLIDARTSQGMQRERGLIVWAVRDEGAEDPLKFLPEPATEQHAEQVTQQDQHRQAGQKMASLLLEAKHHLSSGLQHSDANAGAIRCLDRCGEAPVTTDPAFQRWHGLFWTVEAEALDAGHRRCTHFEVAVDLSELGGVGADGWPVVGGDFNGDGVPQAVQHRVVECVGLSQLAGDAGHKAESISLSQGDAASDLAAAEGGCQEIGREHQDQRDAGDQVANGDAAGSALTTAGIEADGDQVRSRCIQNAIHALLDGNQGGVGGADAQ